MSYMLLPPILIQSMTLQSMIDHGGNQKQDNHFKKKYSSASYLFSLSLSASPLPSSCGPKQTISHTPGQK